MKEKIRIFVCNKCCNTAYTTDGSIPGACTSQYWVRTSGICGGHYSEIEGADFGWVINQEVEKRIAERMPSEEVNQPIFQRPEKKYTYQDIDIAYATGVFNVVGIDGLSKELKRLSDIGKSPHDIFNSRLTCSEKPNNSQKTEGGEG